MNRVGDRLCALRAMLTAAAPWVALLFLRVLVGWEFLEAGLEKLGGENWFDSIQDKFIFPFNLLPVDVSWSMAMWFEIVGGIALILGVGTRFFALSLLVLTVVATAAVHLPDQWSTLAELWRGYVISNKGHGNFKLPLIFMTMLWPLMFYGPGRLSIDGLIHGLLSRQR
ncbi:MAG: DoxX family protein [Lautropia sp.]|nr:DoxX family protein [Lautropia sp.]